MSKEVKFISNSSESVMRELIQASLDEGWELISLYYRYDDRRENRGYHYAWLTKEKK